MFVVWEEFKAGPTTPRERRLHVTLSPKCVIHLNGNVYERLRSPEHVVLLFDRVNSLIGIAPAPAGRMNAFPVKTKGHGRHRIIWAAPFCRHYGIKVETVKTFVRPEFDESGFLRLDLKATTVAVKRRNVGRAL